jgi:hypothetical protein
MIQLRPAVPEGLAILIVVTALLMTVVLFRRENRTGGPAKLLLAIRLLAVTAIALILQNPVRTMKVDAPKTKSPILVLVDGSHSMSVKDVNGRARIDAVREALFKPDVEAAFAKGHTPRYFSFSDTAVAKTPDSLAKPEPVTGSHTYIGDSLAGALKAAGKAESGGVLLVSDGRDNGDIAPVEVARQLRTRGFSVFTACVGTQNKTKDVAVVINRPQVFGAVNQEVTLAADVASTGFPKTDATIRLMREGQKVAEKVVPLNADGHTEVTFTTKEAAKGTYRYTVESEPLPGEVTAANNRASSLLTIGNQTTQVLVLEGRPTWDVKFLAQTLRSDPSLSVDCVYQLTSSRTFAVQGVTSADEQDQAVKVPQTRAEFGKYDVVMIGKGFEGFFDDKSAKALEEYVSEDGGHVIFLRGPAADTDTPVLSALNPVAWDTDEVHDFRMEITQDGASNPAFGFGGNDPGAVIQRLPTLISATRVEKEKALSVVLARASGATNSQQPNMEMALVAYMRHGDGLVVSLVGQGLWRWAMLPPDLQDYAKCYADFWTQLVRWTVDQSDFLPGQDLVLRTDHYSFSPGERVNFTCISRGSNREPLSAATIMAPDGHSYRVSLAKASARESDYVGSFVPKTPGDYVATVSRAGSRGGQVTAPFSVFERREEDMNTSADPALMADIAKAGGGKAISIDEFKQLPRLIDEAKAWQTAPPEPQSIWDRWPVLLAILGLLSLEWIVRRRTGLV